MSEIGGQQPETRSNSDTLKTLQDNLNRHMASVPDLGARAKILNNPDTPANLSRIAADREAQASDPGKK